MHETELNRVERTLARLGIEELEERLELAPVVATDDVVPGDENDGCCRNFCICDVIWPKAPEYPGDIR